MEVPSMANELKWTQFFLAVLVLAIPVLASAQMTFSSVVVFGTSLSDP